MPDLRKYLGFTLVELLISIVIIGMLTIAVVFNVRGQRTKANDAIRKSDLEKIKIALYEYYFDNGCFPEDDQHGPGPHALDCGKPLEGEESDYMPLIPCDPVTGESYAYQTPTDSCPQQFRLLVNLERTNDPSIEQAGCGAGPGQGCGEKRGTIECNYNYGVSSTNVRLSNGCSNYWACHPGGSLRNFADPFISECPVFSVHQEEMLSVDCGINANRCGNASGFTPNDFW